MCNEVNYLSGRDYCEGVDAIDAVDAIDLQAFGKTKQRLCLLHPHLPLYKTCMAITPMLQGKHNKPETCCKCRIKKKILYLFTGPLCVYPKISRLFMTLPHYPPTLGLVKYHLPGHMSTILNFNSQLVPLSPPFWDSLFPLYISFQHYDDWDCFSLIFCLFLSWFPSSENIIPRVFVLFITLTLDPRIGSTAWCTHHTL